MNRKYLAVPRRTHDSRAPSTQQLLGDFAQAAQHTDGVSDVAVGKSSVVFCASPEALEQLQVRFERSVIIEPERYLDPLA